MICTYCTQPSELDNIVTVILFPQNNQVSVKILDGGENEPSTKQLAIALELQVTHMNICSSIHLTWHHFDVHHASTYILIGA
jgi:hypothetical protein